MNLLERIDHWAAVAPDAIAHVSGERKLTFGELRTRSNSVAAYLRDRCDNDCAPVAVLGHREPEMLIAFIGTVKSGRPYVPIDTTLPDHRIDHILKIAKPAFVLTPAEVVKLCESNVDREYKHQPRPNDPFYIIFTSGSTGEPKGIVITLESLEHFLTWMLQEQKFVELGETFLNQAPFSFDLSVMDLYCSLATGGKLFSVDRDLIANPRLLYRALAASSITTWVSTPSFVEMCAVERGFNESLLPQVRRFLFCGEVLSAKTAALLIERFPRAEVWNLYGPTEATVAATSVRIDRAVLAKYPILPVGRPMLGAEVFLVDEDRKISGAECHGEIVIKGPNVSCGYLGRPDLTSAVFRNENGERSYFTGDRGRLHDGLLFYEGRIDRQIKLNGHRIELGDVEANLRALPFVRDAAVLPASKNGKIQWLAAFVVPDLDHVSDNLTADLRESLSERVPTYMLPRKFVTLDRLPMTANCKIDRQKLAELL